MVLLPSSPSLIGTVAVGFLTIALAVLLRYRASIRRRLRELHESSFFGKPKDPFRIVRVKEEDKNKDTTRQQRSNVPLKMRLVDLDDDFVRSNPEWKMMSLGDYFSSLRPATMSQDLPEWIEREMTAGLAAALMKALGPSFGLAFLPTLGAIDGPIQRVAGGVAAYLVSRWSNSGVEPSERSGIPLSIFAMTYAAELNYQRVQRSGSLTRKPPTGHPAPMSTLKLLKQGEVGFKPSFDASEDGVDSVAIREDTEEIVLPNPFVFLEHWPASIEAMEKLMGSNLHEWKSTSMESTDSESARVSSPQKYEPDSKAMKPPEPISERFLPDLHIGWGGAECTHTQREILKNRLLSVVLNRLASNYYFHDERPFEVSMDGVNNACITKPHELIQELVKMGHQVEACVRTHTTTFGVALCVRGDDKSFTNIPLAYFLQNGYVDEEGREAFVCLPHSGLDLEIRGGPLIQKCSIQHFMSIDGLCGWQSNHNADVPWIVEADCGEKLVNEMVTESICIAAMEAIVINGVGTMYELPFGGYGLTGVCNDSAGLIEYALFEKTNIYPLTFNGRFAMHSLRFARDLKRRLEQLPHATVDVQALERLMDAISSLPSDINSLPFEAIDQCRRQLHCLNPRLPFALQRQTKEVVCSVLKELKGSL